MKRNIKICQIIGLTALFINAILNVLGILNPINLICSAVMLISYSIKFGIEIAFDEKSIVTFFTIVFAFIINFLIGLKFLQ